MGRPFPCAPSAAPALPCRALVLWPLPRHVLAREQARLRRGRAWARAWPRRGLAPAPRAGSPALRERSGQGWEEGRATAPPVRPVLAARPGPSSGVAPPSDGEAPPPSSRRLEHRARARASWARRERPRGSASGTPLPLARVRGVQRAWWRPASWRPRQAPFAALVPWRARPVCARRAGPRPPSGPLGCHACHEGPSEWGSGASGPRRAPSVRYQSPILRLVMAVGNGEPGRGAREATSLAHPMTAGVAYAPGPAASPRGADETFHEENRWPCQWKSPTPTGC